MSVAFVYLIPSKCSSYGFRIIVIDLDRVYQVIYPTGPQKPSCATGGHNSLFHWSEDTSVFRVKIGVSVFMCTKRSFRGFGSRVELMNIALPKSPYLWNKIPVEVRDQTNLKAFKLRLSNIKNIL